MTLTPNVYLLIDVDNKRGRIVDSTNYAENNIDVSALSAKGLGTVTGPNGMAIIVANTIGNPLVNLSTSVEGQWFNLPLDNNSNILNGTYSFTYAVRYAIVNGTINSITATSTAELEFVHAGAVLQDGDSIVFAGNGDAENNGTFTIATATYDTETDNSTITVDETTLVTDASPAGTYSFDVTRSSFASGSYTYSGCTQVTLAVTTTYDCESTQLGQIIFKDTTDYQGQTLSSRTLTGYYPNGLTPEPSSESVSTPTASLTFNELAVGTWTHKLVSSMSVTQDDGLVYTYTLTDTAEHKVTCAGTLCGLSPCIKSLNDSFIANYSKGTANNLIPALVEVNTLVTLANEYKTCGEYDKYKSTVSQLETFMNSTGLCNCGCCDESTDLPYWVDNSNQSSSMLTELFAQVGGLEYIVASNASAQAAYNTLMSNLTSILADAVEVNTELNTIQSAILALNPSSDTFDDDVQAIVDNLGLADVNVLALQSAINDWINELSDFNTTFPQYQSYTVAASILLNSVSTAIDALPADIDALIDLLVAVTSATFLDDIEVIQSQIEGIIQSIGSIVYELYQTQSTITEISNTINYILETLTSIQNQLLQIDQSPYKVCGVYLKETIDSSSSVLAYIPAAFMSEKSLVKFEISGEGIDVADEVRIVNTNTAVNLLTIPVGAGAFKLSLDLKYYASSGFFRLGGACMFGGALSIQANTNIDTTTDLALNEDCVLELKNNGPSISLMGSDIIAYKIN